MEARLLLEAARYASLGYKVGLAGGKAFLAPYRPGTKTLGANVDGISVIMDRIVCVDFDCDFKDLGWRRDLPYTWKEKTRRGWHLFYRLPAVGKFTSRVHWQEDVDLLTCDHPTSKRRTRYQSDDGDEQPWGQHVIVSPTPGYRRVWPDSVPAKHELTEAPSWLLEQLQD